MLNYMSAESLVCKIEQNCNLSLFNLYMQQKKIAKQKIIFFGSHFVSLNSLNTKKLYNKMKLISQRNTD